MSSQVYMGAGGQATPLHFDPTENLLCMVEGEKTGYLWGVLELFLNFQSSS